MVLFKKKNSAYSGKSSRDRLFIKETASSRDDRDLTRQALMVTERITVRDKLSLRLQDALSNLTDEQLEAVW